VVCDDKEITQESISYKKVCRDVVDVICEASKPVTPVGAENPFSAVPAIPAVPATPAATERLLPYVSPYHQCHDVPRQHCFLMPVVEDAQATVPHCHVRQK